jgi:hypothetical protein
VTVPERLDITKQLGYFTKPKHIVRRDEYSDLSKIPCGCEDKIGAEQIFPVFTHTDFRTPTIKHHCPKTCLASALRACSNKVRTDPTVFDDYAAWFRSNFIPKFLDYMSQEHLVVDLEAWLQGGRFNKAYQNKIRKSMDYETKSYEPYNYEAFSKVEMQFTTTLHDLKETPLNDVKERQISGPSDQKKGYANPFINLLEGVAHKHMRQYCGRKNWMEICLAIEKASEEIPNIIHGASDGSGFDMSQLREHNGLMNELFVACAKHPNVQWKEPLSVDEFIRVISESIILNVSMDHGKLKYRAEGRASGDGWTTFGNTMLMISYWMYTFHLAGIKNYYLLVKGDDVLFGFDKHYMQDFMQAQRQVFTDRKDFHRHGLAQICKIIHFGDITDLDFLSNHFFYTLEGRLRMTRIPARVIQTISWSHKLTQVPPTYNHDLARQELCYSKGMCLLAWGKGLPIWDALGRKMVELGKQGKFSEFNQYSDGERKWHDRDDYEAYLTYLDNRYGIDASDVVRVEKKIASLSTLYGELEDDVFNRLYN